MERKCKLIVTDSYFGVFNVLKNEIGEKTKGINGKNVVFCEDKVSLMAERVLCANGGGTFNTDVYSFGKYLRTLRENGNALSKEGASMAVKRILTQVPLKRFSASRLNLAPSLYELIIQLKSAKVTAQDILTAVNVMGGGLLKDKLQDIYTVYSEYEKFLNDGGYEDQSSLLNYLPEEIQKDQGIKDSEVYLVGYRSWTAQAKQAVSALVKNAKSVTAILTGGDNTALFLNETIKSFRNICEQAGVSLIESKVDSEYSFEGKILKDRIFNPFIKTEEIFKTDNVFCFNAQTNTEEVERVAQTIKKTVLEGKCRYRDITVAIPESNSYKNAIRRAFKTLEIPFFLDERKAPLNHPLISLVFCYADARRKNLEQDSVIRFFKNPLVCEDKEFSDRLENYIVKYNISYNKFKKPFTFGTEEEQKCFGEFCAQNIQYLLKPDIRTLLNGLKVEEKLNKMTERLFAVNEIEQAEVNKQIYQAVLSLIDQMQLILGDVKLSDNEFKHVFESGVSALKLSILPQRNDAVFVGGYKEVALAKAGYLYVLGMDASVPNCSADVSLLSDSDISSLENLSVLIEPKIKIVNDRERESVGMAVCAFDKKLIVSYTGNATTVKSEVLTCIEKLFTVQKLRYKDEYLTKKQGLITFGKACGEYADANLSEGPLDFSIPTAFYKAMTKYGSEADKILTISNKEIAIRLDLASRSLIGKTIAPTAIESYYSCPYKAFLANTLKLKDRDNGELLANGTGIIMHSVLECYVKKIIDEKTDENGKIVYDIKPISNRQESDLIVDDIIATLKQTEDFSKILNDVKGESALERIMAESKKYCWKVYCQYKRSLFRPLKTEAWLSSENPVKFLGGKVRLTGKIDRVDSYGDYVRIIDYKTGGVKPSNEELFTGRNIQLYLYASSFSDKRVAGLYYYKMQNDYTADGEKELATTLGKTLDDKELLIAQDSDIGTVGNSDFITIKKDGVSGGLTKEAMEAFIRYAKAVAENAVEQMADGVIVASPYDGCEYCKFKGICTEECFDGRKIGAIGDDVIVNAVGGVTDSDEIDNELQIEVVKEKDND